MIFKHNQKYQRLDHLNLRCAQDCAKLLLTGEGCFLFAQSRIQMILHELKLYHINTFFMKSYSSEPSSFKP